MLLLGRKHWLIIYTLLLKLSDILFLPGMHPESVYLHNESSRQAAECKEFASCQRAYETAYISRKYKMDEDYVSGWWKVCISQVQFVISFE